MLIGGAEDKVRDRLILSRFAGSPAGSGGHVVVVSTASSLGDLATERYRELFGELGIGEITGIRPEERAEAETRSSPRARRRHGRVPHGWEPAPALLGRLGTRSPTRSTARTIAGP